MVIITAGMIGVGKTTLTGKIAKHLGTKAFFEPVGDNPVLPLTTPIPSNMDFYFKSIFKQTFFNDQTGFKR